MKLIIGLYAGIYQRGVDFEDTTDEEIKYIETWINNYPRGIFDFKTSAELFDEELQKLA